MAINLYNHSAISSQIFLGHGELTAIKMNQLSLCFTSTFQQLIRPWKDLILPEFL
ncbi:MAG: hypothetical protein WBA93_03830 [Microcoleaceae cyanobacterium]